MHILTSILDFILHIDEHLAVIVQQYGLLTYLILFGIIFAETGLVFFPFLPGDSLLFAVGALSAMGSFKIVVVWAILFLAAFLGDTVNYWIGHFFGQKLVDNPRVPIKQSHIDKTNAFYAKHGGKTILLARFVPIVRTFAPFVAGVGGMQYSKFLMYNIVGGFVWVTLFTMAGYFFGNIPFVQHNFESVVVAIILLSVLPMVWEYYKSKREHVAEV
jgi:membrane-associated protein